MTPKYPQIALSLFVLSACWTSASSIVNWSGSDHDYLGGITTAVFQGSYISGDVSFGGGAATDRQSIRRYSTTAAFSPTTPYPNGLSGVSTTFYGAQETLAIDKTSGSPLGASSKGVIQTAATSGAEIYSKTTAASYDYVLTTIITFKKDDFLNGANSGVVSLTSGSAFSLSVASGITSNMRGRWLVQNGTKYYLSSSTFSLDGGTYAYAYDDTTTWAEYTPATTTGQLLNFSGSTFTTQTFDDVQSLGFYVETWDGTDQILTGSTIADLEVTGFGVALVPEPTTAQYIIGGLAFVVGIFSRKKRSMAISGAV